jgi:hypothetical protein
MPTYDAFAGVIKSVGSLGHQRRSPAPASSPWCRRRVSGTTSRRCEDIVATKYFCKVTSLQCDTPVNDWAKGKGARAEALTPVLHSTF